ncbi:MAG: M23 family metallopeptidase [Bacteroidales bacterium]|nr:M23 family metallopeptidase [Bacteroidales bacterium]
MKITPGQKLKKTLVFVFTPVLLLSAILFLMDLFADLPKESILSRQSELKYQQLVLLDYKLDSLSSILAQEIFLNDNSFRAILQMDSLANSIREAGTGGSELNIQFQNLNNPVLLLKLAKKLNKIDLQLQIQEESHHEISVAADTWKKKINSVPLIFPISKNDLIFISSEFGGRLDPFCKEFTNHTGCDYVAATGTKVYATGNGIVTFLNYSRKGYGNEVIIDHSFGFSTRYAHLHKILVESGDSVNRGQVIGLVGNTGRSTGPHLHYEVRFEGQPLNPFFYYSDEISGDEYEMMVRKNNSTK